MVLEEETQETNTMVKIWTDIMSIVVLMAILGTLVLNYMSTLTVIKN